MLTLVVRDSICFWKVDAPIPNQNPIENLQGVILCFMLGMILVISFHGWLKRGSMFHGL
jgi:hypothetical protein